MILQVVLIDLALGGDNSIVIGMAAKNLPKHLQKRAILYGTAGAICMRFIMAFIVSWLFQIPFLKTVGAILLVLIGIKLIGADDQEEDVHVEAKDSLWAAVRTIIMASTIVVKVMNRFPILIYIGGAILGWASGGMMATDHYLAQYVSLAANNPTELKIILLVVTIAGGFIWKRIHKNKEVVA